MGNYPGDNYPGSNFPQTQFFSEAIFLGGSCAVEGGGGNCLGKQLSGGAIIRRAIIRGALFLGKIIRTPSKSNHSKLLFFD